MKNNNQRKLIYKRLKEIKPLFVDIEFNIREDGLGRFRIAYLGKVENLGMTYNILKELHTEGYFSVKVIPPRSNLCLFEERVGGDLKALVA